MKYIMTRYGPILFPNVFEHREVAEMAERAFGNPKTTSAGFAAITPGKISVGGDSLGLGLKARPEDATAIAEEFMRL
jgi:hypothetical protein